MLLHVFASESTAAERNGTMIYVESEATSLPMHAVGGEWRYVATMGDDNVGLILLRNLILAGIEMHGFYITPQHA